MICFTVPGPPVAKGRPRLTVQDGHARAFTPAKTVAYEGLVAMAGQRAMGTAAPLECAVALDVVATFAAPKRLLTKKMAEKLASGSIPHVSRPDADNIVKAISDGLNGIVFRDDAQICDVSLSKRYGEVPGVAVTVRAL